MAHLDRVSRATFSQVLAEVEAAVRSVPAGPGQRLFGAVTPRPAAMARVVGALFPWTRPIGTEAVLAGGLASRSLI